MTERQRDLFDRQPAAWQCDDAAEQLTATIVFVEGPEGEFDYVVPDRLADEIEVGKRVRVPLGRGNRAATGYCVRVEQKAAGGRKLKPVSGVVDSTRLLAPAMLRLTGWIAEHYLCPWGQVLDAVVPAGVRGQAGTRLTTLLSVAGDLQERVKDVKLAPKQAAVLKVLSAANEPMTITELGRAAGCTEAPITALRRKGLIRAEARRVQFTAMTEASAPRRGDLALNPDQKTALEAILAALQGRRHQTLLIHGVTGSGKTEVYIRAIQEVVGFGRQAIVLVPEISLTPQTVQRFRERFDHVAVLHSHLSDAERQWQWQRIAEGGVQVVVGARSAIFAPTPHLGLIVLDEEHESSFKQESAPRYHARDVAIARAEAEDVPLVLGSATPSLESWHRAQTGVYRLIDMPRRVLDRPLPAVGTIDLRTDDHARHSRGSISRHLHAAMHEALDRGGQVILLLNRRGFSTHIQCPSCGNVVRCPDCDIALTHHRSLDVALCHYCDHQIPTPSACPQCHFAGIRYSGTGTQRLEAEVRTRFPGVPCLRMDTDTMQGRGAHERALGAFREGRVRILLGTQMIAKGLDFPNVTLVGVINADTALHLPDFRAAERTFHLVTQVAGRTGRGEKGGRVLVQTLNPDHPAIQAAVHHDYQAFADGELPIRKMLSYPPFARMIRIVVRGQSEEAVARFAACLAEELTKTFQQAGGGERVLGPAPAPFSKLRGKYRFQIQMQGSDADRLRQAVREIGPRLKPPDDIQWIADVDPLDML
ncbi:MAG: primosomal protein N' [Rhodopirellula sp.]|nr:primosomal protein N' [Rhodopirellula sp.]